MITLGIETSCDETSVALLETISEAKNNANFGAPITYRVLAHTTFSQIDIHAVYGGVFPVIAKREHARRLIPLLLHTIHEANLEMTPINQTPESLTTARDTVTSILKEKESDLLAILLDSPFMTARPAIDRIAVTVGPGLEPALWVGVNFAQALTTLWNIPVIPVNHMEGHIVSTFLKEKTVEIPSSPILALLVSGGHTELVRTEFSSAGANCTFSYSILGSTRDDAVGEAYDKVARMMNLPYPGGPVIARLAQTARDRFALSKTTNPITLPRPMLHSPDLDFSFSGLKTSVLYLIEKMKTGSADQATMSPETIENIALAFEDAVTEVLITKTRKALEQQADTATPIQALIIGGGVIANTHIRVAFEALACEFSIPLELPARDLTGDNALMIALAGALKNNFAPEKLKAVGNLSLEN